MIRSNNNLKYSQLRNEYPEFTYKGFEYHQTGEGLKVRYHFDLSEKYAFHPELTLPAREFFKYENAQGEVLENLLFHIGLVELVSYWKCACPPKIIIEKYRLNETQVKWWKKLYFKGLGEFFYLNSIEVTEEGFVEISCSGDHEFAAFSMPLDESCIIPVGGGKDSVVTLELLKAFENSLPLILNPRPASMGCVMKQGFYYDTIIEVKRTIDPVLLDLNAKGFLNGHTPFSALLAFVSLLAAVLSGKKYVVLSNEFSANEFTVAENAVNHQYSKSVEFEGDFRRYVKDHINADVEYFSFLRPLNELQIAYHFSKFTGYHDVFRSCNAGSKEDTWCGKCAKCLFTYIILSPFMEKERLKSIFSKDLLDDPGLVSLLDELTGISANKPFDCIGTIDEVNAALILCIKGIKPGEEPMLISHYKNSGAYQQYVSINPLKIMMSYNSEHFLPAVFEDVLKKLSYEGFDQDKTG